MTVCELPGREGALEEAWSRLVEHALAEEPDLVVLPEMPFHRWLPVTEEASGAAWERAMEAHGRWIDRLSELDGAGVAGTRPVVRDGRRLNEGFLWSASDDGLRAAHRKRYLPDEPGFWEASWYDRGSGRFRTRRWEGIAVAFMICTDLWFLRHARSFAAEGAHLLVCPRATPAYSEDKWLAAGRTAAVVAGAFGLSSNRAGRAPGVDWAGGGWIIGPDGDVLGTTSREEPFLTREIDLESATAAKETYPRYVEG